MDLAAPNHCAMTNLFPNSAVGGRVLMLCAEDPQEVLQQRIQSISAFISGKPSFKNLDLRSCIGQQVDLMNDDWYRQVLEVARGARLIILDTLTRFHNLDENSAQDMKKLLGRLESLAQESGAALLYMHHTSKAAIRDGFGSTQQAARGSSVIVDNSRWVAYLAPMTPAEAREYGIAFKDMPLYVRWNIAKQNYGASRPDQWYMRQAGGALLAIELKRQSLAQSLSRPLLQPGELQGEQLPGSPAEPVVSIRASQPIAPGATPSAKNVNNGNW